MKDYVKIIKDEDSISVCLYPELDKVFQIGEKMNAINEEAYMNGYNWEAFFNYYLAKHHPDILNGMDSDPEAGMYAADYPLTAQNEIRAKQFVAIIQELIESEARLLEIVRNEGGQIEWD